MARQPGCGWLRHLRRDLADLRAPAGADARARRRGQPRVPARRLHRHRRCVCRRRHVRGCVPHRPRCGLARARRSSLPRHRAAVPSRLQGLPRVGMDPEARRRRRPAPFGCDGRRRGLRPRRIDDPHGAGVPGVTVRRLRLPRAVDRHGPQTRRGSRRVRPRALRAGVRQGLPAGRLRPHHVLRLPPRHG